MAPGDVEFAPDVLAHAVETVEEEKGVRNLKRAMHDVVSSVNFERLMAAAKAAPPNAAPGAPGGASEAPTKDPKDPWELPIRVTKDHVAKYVRTGRRDAAGDKNTSLMSMYM
jgi:ATP-dependent Lon protease